MLKFEIEAQDARSQARAGRLTVNGRTVETPVFFPVGTQGTVKAVVQKELVAHGVHGMLCNLYHLYLRPGIDVIEAAGGLHRFINWDGLIITDSGGFQVYSLKTLRKIEPEGVHFVSHLDGSSHLFTPENVLEMQARLGSDIAMVLDECVEYPTTFDYARNSMNLTLEWARRSAERLGQGTGIFAIVQGATFPELRIECARRLVGMGFDGYAIGGLAVGEAKDTMFEMVRICTAELPERKPRYLMGVGFPVDIARAVSYGVDVFDCVMPTRNARNGTLFVESGRLVIKNSQFSRDGRPIQEGCDCYTCRNFSRSYLRHLYISGEILSAVLNSIHNIRYYMRLMSQIRDAIRNGQFEEFLAELEAKQAEEIDIAQVIIGSDACE